MEDWLGLDVRSWWRDGWLESRTAFTHDLVAIP
jgi:hypothetical protein